jgi:hypothetical protein
LIAGIVIQLGADSVNGIAQMLTLSKAFSSCEQEDVAPVYDRCDFPQALSHILVAAFHQTLSRHELLQRSNLEPDSVSF